MTKYKLTYFNIRGRGELIRLIFVVAGVEYEDVRIEMPDWPAIKPEMPFRQMPILEIDGVLLCQSYAIARYLARKFNLAGKTDVEQARVDMIIDCFEDTIKPRLGFKDLQDAVLKAELVKKFLTEHIPTSLTCLENLLKENSGGDGFFVGDELTWADLGLVNLTEWLSMFPGAEPQVANYPKLNALRQRVQKLPTVAEWLANRPVTDI